MPQHPESQVQARASEPTDLPAVESCANQVSNQREMGKSEAIATCIDTLKRSGRIEQRDGEWVQLPKAKQKKGAR